MSELEVRFEVGDEWPTPNNCRRVADALDGISSAKYGEILRAYADAEDRRCEEHGRARAARASLRRSEGREVAEVDVKGEWL